MKIKNIHYLFILIVMLVSACTQPGTKKDAAATTDSTATGKIPVKKMRADLAILWAAVKEMHPAYGIFTPTDTLQVMYLKTMESIDQPLTETDFITHIYPLVSAIRCGHTQIRHSEGYKPGQQQPALPFEVLVRHHRAWVTTHQTSKLATGDEVMSVNSIPVATIINHGYNLYSGDGYNETFKELFLSEYDGFEDVCHKYYHWKAPYQLAIRTAQGEVKNITVGDPEKGAAPATAVADNYAGWTLAKNTDYLPLRFLKNGPTAWFVTKPYAYTDTVIFKEAFKQIHQQGIKNLILDMRHNTGGDIRVARMLLSYLADTNFTIVQDIRARIPNPAKSSFAKYFDTSRTASYNSGFAPGEKEPGLWYHTIVKPVFGQLYGQIPVAKTNRFRGNLYVLIDGATFSSGALFTAALKAQHANAKFIGRETAGGEEGCSGGTLQHLTLPNTGVIVEFPWMRFVSAAKKYTRGHGIMPDYQVDYTPQDVVTKKDRDVEKALSLIK